jgi:ZIP family zinc transporter
MESNVLIAFGLTAFAGLATGLGALVVFFTRKPKLTLLSFGLGFSSGVMVYISLVELLPIATVNIVEELGEGYDWLSVACFFGGMALSALIDKLVPEPQNPHEVVSLENVQRASVGEGPSDEIVDERKQRSLMRLGLLSALAIGVHNFPEGMATFASSLSDPTLGMTIAIAVAIHNIPEGIAVAVPIYFATRSRGKAFFHSFLSGLAEPIGALLVYVALLPVIEDHPVIVECMLAGVGGVMVFISFDELLPTAREYGKGHTAIIGVVLGMAVMAISLLLL